MQGSRSTSELRKHMERLKGNAPSYPVWKAGAFTSMLQPHTVPLGTAFVKLTYLLLAKGLLAFTISCISSYLV